MKPINIKGQQRHERTENYGSHHVPLEDPPRYFESALVHVPGKIQIVCWSFNLESFVATSGFATCRKRKREEEEERERRGRDRGGG